MQGSTSTRVRPPAFSPSNPLLDFGNINRTFSQKSLVLGHATNRIAFICHSHTTSQGSIFLHYSVPTITSGSDPFQCEDHPSSSPEFEEIPGRGLTMGRPDVVANAVSPCTRFSQRQTLTLNFCIAAYESSSHFSGMLSSSITLRCSASTSAA